MRITKQEWIELGGLRNSQLYRKQRSDGAWAYYISTDWWTG